MITLQSVQEDVLWEMTRDFKEKSDADQKAMAYAGLGEEAGEVLGIYKREVRNYKKDQERITVEHKLEELGDVLWYLAMICNVEDLSLEQIWKYNREKLEARYG